MRVSSAAGWLCVGAVAFGLLLSGREVAGSEGEGIAINEEANCHSFLTKEETSPLYTDLKRDFARDEDGEFSCLVTIQNRDLPLQARLTIHEGLSYLYERHIQMGLERHKEALEQMKIMLEILPKNFLFHTRIAFFYLDPVIADVKKAIYHLENAIYEAALVDENVPTNVLLRAKRELARLYALTNNYEQAERELLSFFKMKPIDFHAAFMLKEVMNALVESNPQSEVALQSTERIFEDTVAHVINNYDGFTVDWDSKNPWKPSEFSEIPSAEVMQEYVERREPFVIRAPSDGSNAGIAFLKKSFGWNVDTWFLQNEEKGVNTDYLSKKAGDANVLIERRYTESLESDNGVLGYSLDVLRMQRSFDQFLRSNFDPSHNRVFDKSCEASSHDEGNADTNGKCVSSDLYEEYLNIQQKNASHGIWRSPLHLLKDDLSIPSFLGAYAQDVTEVNLWLGNSHNSIANQTVSRLHEDATDNLYVLLKGKKTFQIISPQFAGYMRTVSPTYAIMENGYSFQFPNAITSPNEDFHYLDVNNHFSMAKTPADPMLGNGANKATFIDLKEGDMLYLPSGWFHQVTSHDGPHAALNFWWKPPRWQDAQQAERSLMFKVIQSIQSKKKSATQAEA